MATEIMAQSHIHQSDISEKIFIDCENNNLTHNEVQKFVKSSLEIDFN